jgi:hypothetical protein
MRAIAAAMSNRIPPAASTSVNLITGRMNLDGSAFSDESHVEWMGSMSFAMRRRD